MTTPTLGATAPLNGYIKPTTTFVQLELESGILTAASEVKEVEVETNTESNSLDFENENAFDTSTSFS